MIEALFNLFHNLDYFAQCASNVDIEKYKNVIRSNCIFSRDGSEEGAYFCAVPKMHCDSVEIAISILFINSLYDFEEWDKEKKPFDHFNRIEWKKYLKEIWIPEYFACSGTSLIPYKQVDSIEKFPIADKLWNSAIPSPAILTIRYGMTEAWNSFDYLIETEHEYIDFQSWTSA